MKTPKIEKEELSKCCEKCKCNNLTSDHQFIMGIHKCDNPSCPCHQPKKVCKECQQIMETGYGECLEHNPEKFIPKDLTASWEVEFNKIWFSSKNLSDIRPNLLKLISEVVKEERERIVKEIEKLKIFEDQSPNFIRDEIINLINHSIIN